MVCACSTTYPVRTVERGVSRMVGWCLGGCGDVEVDLSERKITFSPELASQAGLLVSLLHDRVTNVLSFSTVEGAGPYHMNSPKE